MNYPLRFLRLILGLLICGLGITLIYKANLGMNPWGTLDLGLRNTFGITIGFSSQSVGFFIIIASLFLGIRPGIGTLINMVLIGFFVDQFNNLIRTVTISYLPYQLLTFIVGLMTLNFGIYFYLSARLGGGPRDGLMLGLVKKFHWQVAPVRMTIEATALTVGFLLGGKVGIGTVILSLFNGPILQNLFKFFKFDPKKTEQESIDTFIMNLFKNAKSS